jgi:hypothetical protein
MPLSNLTNIIFGRYSKRNVPEDPKIPSAFRKYLSDEFQSIEVNLQEFSEVTPQATDREPNNPRTGMMRYAVSPWNPLGNGTLGLVVYNGSSWEAVQGSGSGGGGGPTDAIQDTDFTTNGLMKRTGNGTYTSVTDNSNAWDTAYGWGNHGSAGYLTSYTETDPIFSAHAAAGVTSTKISNWDTAYGWGDHSGVGYLTSHQDISGKASLTGAIFSGTVFIGTSNVNTGTANFLVGHSHSTTNDRNIVSGYDNNVTGSNNNVSGQENNVSGDVSLVTGYANVTGSSGDRGITAGYSNYNYSENSIIGGSNNNTGSSAHSCIVSGFNNSANGSHCFSVGYQCSVGSATKWFSTALGYQTKSYGNASFTGGRAWYDGSTKYTQVDADAGFAYGSGNHVFANAPSSIALGTLTHCGETSPATGVTAAQSMAIGYRSKAYKDNSFAGGNQSYSFGDTSFSFGNGAVASNGFSNIALGRGITTPVSGSNATTIGAVSVGQWNEYAVTTEQHFSVGTGTADGSRYTSMYVGPRSSTNSGIVMQALKDTTSYTSDNAAALGGVPIGGLYRYFSYVRIRMT